MNNLEAYIQASYHRLHERNTVFLLRNRFEGYDNLPDPADVTNIYKASVVRIPEGDYASGVNIVDWPNLRQQPVNTEEEPSYSISPRELFLTKEIPAVLRD